MKTPLTLLALLFVITLGPGCGHIDLSAEGDRNRVLQGTVSTGSVLPAGAEISVSLVAPRGRETSQPVGSALPIAPRQSDADTAQVIGEHSQQLAAATNAPVPFRIEYEADDAALRRGLIVEARVSFGGRVRYRTINTHVITLGSVPYRQNITLQPVER